MTRHDNDAVIAQCPSFNRCSCNDCPLDSRRDRRVILPEDPKCKAARKARVTIAARHNLDGGGLTQREINRDKNRARWLAKPESERVAILARLARFSPKDMQSP